MRPRCSPGWNGWNGGLPLAARATATGPRPGPRPADRQVRSDAQPLRPSPRRSARAARPAGPGPAGRRRQPGSRHPAPAQPRGPPARGPAAHGSPPTAAPGRPAQPAPAPATAPTSPAGSAASRLRRSRSRRGARSAAACRGCPPRRPAPAAAAPGVVDTESLRRGWDGILDAVRQVRKVSWIQLSNASVASLEGDVLTLEFARDGELKGFSASGSDAVLARVLRERFGVDWRIRGVPAAGRGRLQTPGLVARRPRQGHRPGRPQAPAARAGGAARPGSAGSAPAARRIPPAAADVGRMSAGCRGRPG